MKTHIILSGTLHNLPFMFYVYILTNISKSVLYVGVTNNLRMRVIEHYRKRGNISSFTGRYNCFNLIYYEEYLNARDAIAREKKIKNRSRAWKEKLIGRDNPEWDFLNGGLVEPWPPDENCFR